MSDLADEKDSILSEFFRLLNARYPHGLYDWLYVQDGAAYNEINRLEDKIDSNFLNSGSISDLKTILREYWAVHMRAIKMFKSHSINTSSNEIRTERIQQRETAHP